MERSGVVASEEDERKNSKTEVSDIRTSYGVFLERGEDDVIKRKDEFAVGVIWALAESWLCIRKCMLAL